MNLALAQMNVLPGQPRKNLETMLRMIEEAKAGTGRAGKVDLIAFPELCVSGYLLGDRWTSDSYCEYLMEFNEHLRGASEGIAIAYGNVYLDRNEEIKTRLGHGNFHPNKDGRTRKYNAVYVFQDGEPAPRGTPEHRGAWAVSTILPPGVQPKSLLPNYRFFDDERYFFSMEDIAKDCNVDSEDITHPLMITVDGREIPIGFEVCEDLWCEDYRRNEKAQNPTKMLIENGAELIINISASPWTYGKNDARDRRIEFLHQDCGNGFIPFLYVNNVGAQNNGKNIITFDGGTTVYNAEGKPVQLATAAYEEEVVHVDTKSLYTAPVVSRPVRTPIAEKLECLIEGIQHTKDMAGRKDYPKFAMGMSGGVDSCVTAALLALAVGKEKVMGLNMPTRFNSEETKGAANHTADSLGISYVTIPVEEIATLNEKIIGQYQLDDVPLTAVQKGNIAAKIRGTAILSNFAAKHGALFTNNGNKLEVALGYATLYGDVNGAIAPLADLMKVEVWELAKYLNEQVFGREVIPAKLIPDELCRFAPEQIQPSAELETNQVDPMKFGYHDALLAMMTDYKKAGPEDIMRHFLEGTLHQQVEKYLNQMTGREEKLGLAMMQRWGVDKPAEFVKDLEWFSRMTEWAVFKRVQTCPIIVTSKSSYGYDIRESILPYEPTFEQERLAGRIREMERYTPSVIHKGGKA